MRQMESPAAPASSRGASKCPSMWCTRNGRHIQRACQGTPDRRADQQSAHQSRAGRVGNSIDVCTCAAGFFQAFIQQRQQLPDVIARSNLRHHAAIFGVDVGLRIQRMGHQAQFAIVNGERRFHRRKFQYPVLA